MTTDQTDTRQFLDDNPEILREYLADNPDLLIKLTPPSAYEALGGEGVVDMQRFMVNRLQNRLSRMESDRGEIIESAHANQSSLSQIHDGVLALLKAKSAEDLFRIVEIDLPRILEIDTVVIGFEAVAEDGDHPRNDGPVHFLDRGAIDGILGFNGQILLRDETPDHTGLYGEISSSIRSDALVRLGQVANHPHCLLALGSANSDLFHPGQGTELLNFLARVLEVCLDRWLGIEDVDKNERPAN